MAKGVRLRAQGKTVLHADFLYLVPCALRPVPESYASFLGTSEALHLNIFHQPLGNRFFDSLVNAFRSLYCPLHIYLYEIDLILAISFHPT